MKSAPPLLAACVAFLVSNLAPTALAVPPVYDHVVVVIDENEDSSEIIGNAAAPYINSLADRGATLTRMHGITHPSQPNYLGLISGDNQGVNDDETPIGTPFSTPNLVAALRAAGRTFIGYAEGLPAAGDITTVSSLNYVRYHCPWVWWVNNTVPTPPNQYPASLHQPFSAFPSDFTQLPTVAIVIPDNSHNMHDTGVAAGDTWLSQNLSAYATWALTHNSLLIVTWDEDSYLGFFGDGWLNQTATIFYGANLLRGQSGGSWTLHNLLRTIEDMYGLTHSGLAAKVPPISGVFAGEMPVTTRTFVNGSNSYTGDHDTMVNSASPTTALGTVNPLIVGGSGTQSTIQSLIRFDDLFGAPPAQVPATGSTIVSAKLFLQTSQGGTGNSLSQVNIHRMLVPWDESSTWNSFAGGIDLDGAEAAATPEFSVVPNSVYTMVGFDVTATIQAVQVGATNNGWTIQTTSADGWAWNSANANASYFKPLLEVSYTASSLGFTSSTASIGEDGGNVVLTVARINDTGAVSVHWATSNITASSATDYTAGSGTLNWAAGDTTDRTIIVPVTQDSVVERDETFKVTLSFATGIAFVANASTIVTIVETPINNWLVSKFGTSGANTPAAAVAADPEGDGLANLAEYALVLSPTAPSQPPGASVFAYAEGDRLRMFVPRDPTHNDITVSVEATGDLAGPWTALATSTLGAPFIGPGYGGGDGASPGIKTVEVRDIVNISAATQRWLRVKVTH